MQTVVNGKAKKQELSSLAVELFTGEEAFNILSDPAFNAGWDALYEACPWATVFQCRDFVASWYQTYKGVYLPIIILGEVGGELAGLLTLAVSLPDEGERNLHKKELRIIGAGHFEAEYQVWLAEEHNGSTFIKAAIEAVRKRFPASQILFRYLPPQTPLSWVTDEPEWKKQCVLEAFRRPLMDLNDPKVSKLFRKNEFRNKLNRLKRLGNLTFERIHDSEEFAVILPELAVQYDFRQGAMFNKNRFRESPLKAAFLENIFKKGLLHVTVLKVDEEILAAIVAVQGKNWVHLGGINVHSASHGGYYSPGFVHFLMLGQQLVKEGVAVFDLTPGGDYYKERMATRHDQVYELTIANSQLFYAKRAVKKIFHKQLIKAGLRPMSVELEIDKKSYLLKNRIKVFLKPSALKARVSSMRSKKSNRIFLIEAGSTNTFNSLKQNKLNDLLDFDGANGWLTRWEFLENAMRRFENGECCYTWSENGRLMCCAWLNGDLPTNGQSKEETKQEIPVVHELYCHSEFSDKLVNFLNSVAKQTINGQILISPSDTRLQRLLENGGCKQHPNSKSII